MATGKVYKQEKQLFIGKNRQQPFLSLYKYC